MVIRIEWAFSHEHMNLHILKEKENIMLFSELKKKEVISVKSCNRIGYVVDLEFDHCTGCIKRIIVSDRCKWLPNLCVDSDCYICFKDIQQIGPDIIIVDV